MKHFFLTVILFASSTGCFSQLLEGEWKGSFNYYRPSKVSYPGEIPFINETSIRFQFTLNADSSYTVYSYTPGLDGNGKDTIHVCAVLYKQLDSDSIYLQEVKLIKPENVTSPCLTVMRLKLFIRKRIMILSGIWKSNNCSSTGQITISRKKQ